MTAHPRTFERAAALYLAEDALSCFPSLHRYDVTARRWRSLDVDSDSAEWTVSPGLAPLVEDVRGRLLSVLRRTLPPFVFVAVYAPEETTPPHLCRDLHVCLHRVPRRFLGASALDAFGSWEDVRRAYADLDGSAARSDADLLSPRQRGRLLRDAESTRAIWRVLESASGLSVVRYRPEESRDVERAFLESLLRIPGAAVTRSALWAAFEDAYPADAARVGRNHFYRVAAEVLGPPRRTERNHVFPGVSLASESAPSSSSSSSIARRSA